jgi:hypothetical protein
MDDPWGSVARGRYAELQMFDRTAVAERTLRVRRLGAGDGDSDSSRASRVVP